MAAATAIGVLAPVPGISNMASGFAKMCRTCAACTECLMPIFSGEGLLNNLAEKIHRHLPIRVSERDRLPQQLCRQCASTLLAWHELVKCCTQADAALRVRLQRLQERAHQEKEANVKHEMAPAAVQPTPIKEQGPTSEQEHKYRCVHCAAAFTQRALYRDHLASVHIDTLFHCRECDDYDARDNLVPHMAHHAQQYHAGEFSDAESDFVIPEAVFSAIEEPTKLAVDEPHKNGLPTIREPGGEISVVERPMKIGLSNKITFAKETSIFGYQDNRKLPPTEETENRSATQKLEKNRLEKLEKKNRSKFRAACDICGKEFRASSSYFYHKKFVHSDKTERKHECEVCGLRCASRAALRDHGATHTGVRPHACQHCPKKFRSKAGLYIHTRDMHSSPSESKYTCAQCDMSFRWRQRLVLHMKRHWNQRPNVCDLCGASFAARCDLTRHARTHGATQRSHTCALCGASFAQPRYLRDHVRKKHPHGVNDRTQPTAPSTNSTCQTATDQPQTATDLSQEETSQSQIATGHTRMGTALSLISPSQALITISHTADERTIQIG